MTNALWRSKAFVIIWQVMLALFGFSLLTSKSGLSIFGVLLVLLTIIGIDWKKFFVEEKLALAILFLYPLAILCGVFSLGGTQTAIHTVIAWPWPLLVLPTVIVKRRQDDQKIFLICLAVSLAIACAYCFYLFGRDFHGQLTEGVRVPSFWDISRWGLFNGLALLFLMALFVGKNGMQISSSWKSKSLLTLLIADFACMILSNNRGPWLALGIGCIALFALYPKSWKIILLVFAAFAVVFASSKSLNSRLNSIAEIQTTSEGQVVSKNPSNKGRLSMWKVALDFYKEQPWFGTGFENSEAPLRKFVERQTAEYREKYTTIEYSYRDQHSSPMTMLVQFGILFSIGFWLVVFTAGISCLRSWWKSRDLFSATIVSALIFHFVLCLFYTSFLSYEVVSFIPLLALNRRAYGSD